MNGRGSAELDGAVEANDLQRVDDILRGVGDSPGSDIERSGSGKPLLASAHSIEMAAKLLEHGFEISDVSRWWASGLFVNPGVDPHVGRFLVDRGDSLLLTPPQHSALSRLSKRCSMPIPAEFMPREATAAHRSILHAVSKRPRFSSIEVRTSMCAMMTTIRRPLSGSSQPRRMS